MRRVDILMPVFNSEASLSHALQALASQEIPLAWQPRLVAIDDGSTDNSITILSKWQASSLWLPSAIKQHEKNKGISAARNTGIDTSDADIVFFLGSDILLRPGSLKQHLTFHDEFLEDTYAALGMVRWDPRVYPSPFMEWMMHGGQQNDFDALLGTHIADPSHALYGSCLSLKRKMVLKDRFPTAYTSYGWEDLDMGRQLTERGLRLHVLHTAIGLHHHRYTAGTILKRQRMIGVGIHQYQMRYPHVPLIPPLTEKRRVKIKLYTILRPFLRAVVQRTSSFLSTPLLFQFVTVGEFWLGVTQKRKNAK